MNLFGWSPVKRLLTNFSTQLPKLFVPHGLSTLDPRIDNVKKLIDNLTRIRTGGGSMPQNLFRLNTFRKFWPRSPSRRPVLGAPAPRHNFQKECLLTRLESTVARYMPNVFLVSVRLDGVGAGSFPCASPAVTGGSREITQQRGTARRNKRFGISSTINRLLIVLVISTLFAATYDFL
jgi:hypothetical protein